MNIWKELKKNRINSNSSEPIMVLAPMADVTDVAFRFVIAKYGKPDVMWTEFVSADGLVLAPGDNPDENGVTSQDKLRADLKFDAVEKPIVAQIFSSNPKNIKKVSRMIFEMGFDGVDINMGCPDRSIEKQKCGSAMIKNPKLAQMVIKAAKDGVGYKKNCRYYLYKFFAFLRLNFLANIFYFKTETRIPVSVKTRIGYYRDELDSWLPNLLAANPNLITVHARTRKEMSKAIADWSRISRAVQIRDDFYNKNFFRRNIKSEDRTLIFGNGDIKNRDEARKALKEANCDGVMIGRGIFGNPWLFGDRKIEDVSIIERLTVMLEHTKKFETDLSHKNFAVMKKHYKAYVDNFDGAKDLRLKLMESNNYEEVARIVRDFINNQTSD